MKKIVGWTVQPEEAGSDAAHRYMVEHGYKAVKRVVVAGMCESVIYIKRGNEYTMASTEYNDRTETVDFAFARR